MRLQHKLNITIGIVLLLVFAAVEHSSYREAQETAIQDLQGQAEKVRALLMAFRRYQQQVILKYNIEMDEVHLNFLPAFAVGKISQEYPNWDNSGFSFENVSDQPRNPEHAADAVELEAMAYFREHPQQQVLFRPFKNPNKNNEEYYLYARPVWVEKYCLACHGKREDAPKLIREKYATAWNYREGDLRGLLSIKLPATTIKARVWETFKQGALLHFAGFICIFFAVSSIIRRTVTQPMRALEQGMQAMAAGDYTHHLQGFQDEFAKISESFNHMSLKVSQQQQALQHLNESLERRVSLRTHELEIAHEKIRRLNDSLQYENLRMGAELEISRQLQQLLLPNPQQLAAITELDIASFTEVATEVGGDYYDILPHAGRIKLCIGDVTGHGLESGMVMLMVQMAVLTLLENEVAHPETFLNILNRAIYANLHRMNSDKTLTLSLLDYHQGHVKVTGQHEEILVVRHNGSVERIDTLYLGFIVGLKADISAFSKHLNLELAIGDGIVLYTDGITEAHNAQDEMYGVERLCQQLSLHWQAGNATAVQQAVIQDLRHYLGAQAPQDDMTLVVVKRVI
jgi:serine phosphatase RsbU (regulator of sigma subunit)